MHGCPINSPDNALLAYETAHSSGWLAVVLCVLLCVLSTTHAPTFHISIKHLSMSVDIHQALLSRAAPAYQPSPCIFYALPSLKGVWQKLLPTRCFCMGYTTLYSHSLQGKRARAKPVQPKAATTVRSSQASFTCFHASAVAPGDTPRHTPQRTPVRQQTASPASSIRPKQGGHFPAAAAAQAPAPPAEASEQQTRGIVEVCAPGSHNTARKQQQLVSSVASLPWMQNAQTAAGLPDQAPLHVVAGGGCLSLSTHADNSPEVGQDHTAGCGVPLLGSPATPSWQGHPAGTPPTPLSSHPIDALEGSEVASASTSTTDAASDSLLVHSQDRSGLLRSAESEAPFSPELGNVEAPSLNGHLPTQDRDRGGSCCLRTDAQPQHSSLIPGQGSHCPEGLSLPLEASAVMLEMESDLAVSADGLISPVSSGASWQRRLAAHSPSSSSHASQPLPAMSHGTALYLDRHQQHLPHFNTDSILESAYPVGSRADGSRGLCHSSAPMSDSSPLPGPWHCPSQPHHYPYQQQGSPSGATSPSSAPWQQQPADLQGVYNSAGQSSQHRTPIVTADYAAAAAQLQQAVAQAEQLYTASTPTDSWQQCEGRSNSMDVIDEASQAGAACSDTSGQEMDAVGGCSQRLPSALPLSSRMGVQHAMRRAAEPAYPMQQPVWVPQGNTPAPSLHKSAFHVFCKPCNPQGSSS